MPDATDNNKPPAGNSPPIAPRPLPEPYVLPPQLLEKWLAIPSSNYVTVQLTRHDIDQLFFGLSKGYSCQQFLHDCIVRWSNGDVPGANEALDNARRLAVEGDNNVRHFFAAIMAAATTK
jgi:hypothetical protein